MEPRDIEVAQTLQLLTTADPDHTPSHPREDFFYEYPGGRNFALADGSIRYWYGGGSPSLDRSWLDITLAATELDEIAAADPAAAPGRRKLGNRFLLGLFALLVFWPLPWVWIPRRSPRFPSEY